MPRTYRLISIEWLETQHLCLHGVGSSLGHEFLGQWSSRPPAIVLSEIGHFFPENQELFHLTVPSWRALMGVMCMQVLADLNAELKTRYYTDLCGAAQVRSPLSYNLLHTVSPLIS